MKNRKVRIVHILEGFSGGLKTYICTVLPELVNAGFDVTLILSLNRSDPDPHKQLTFLKDKYVKINVIPMQREINPLKDMPSFLKIFIFLRQSRFDIVHTHCSKAGAIGRIAAFLSCQKVIFHSPHCFAFLREGNGIARICYRFIERLLGKITTCLIAVSASEAESAVNHKIFPAYKCAVINNALPSNDTYQGDPSEQKTAAKVFMDISPNTRVVVTACRLVEYKGIILFIKAAGLSRTENTVFLIAGDGKLKDSLKRMIVKMGLSQKVKLIGYVNAMEYVYRMSDIIVLCSEAEGQPYLLLEAMRAKIAIVATNVSGNNDLIKTGETGILTDKDPLNIAVEIDRLLADDEIRSRYAENAYSHFCEHHTLAKQIFGLRQIYERFITDDGDEYERNP